MTQSGLFESGWLWWAFQSYGGAPAEGDVSPLGTLVKVASQILNQGGKVNKIL